MKQLALACILFCAALASAQSPKWTDREAWRVKLQLYMTMQQVHFLLGDPVDREVSKIAQIWYYKKGPVRDGGKVVERPVTGIVRFSLIKANPITKQKLPQPVFVVGKFCEPDWTNVPAYVFETKAELLQKKQQEAALARQPALERQKKQQEAALARQQALEQQKQEAAQKREELVKQRQEKFEATKKQREESNEKRQQELQARKAAAEPEEPKNFATMYYFIAGGVFIGTAIMIAVFKKDTA